MKICKDCFWCFTHPKKICAQCMYEKEYSIDLVYGKIKWLNYGDYITCEEARKSDLHCGVDAKWFKSKE